MTSTHATTRSPVQVAERLRSQDNESRKWERLQAVPSRFALISLSTPGALSCQSGNVALGVAVHPGQKISSMAWIRLDVPILA